MVWGDFTVYDDRLGGLRDFNKYVSDATNLYNSWVGVHQLWRYSQRRRIPSGKHPDAVTTVSRRKTEATRPMDIMEQVYTPDITLEALSLERQTRLVGFKMKCRPGLHLQRYAFSGGGWKGRRLAEDYSRQVSAILWNGYQNGRKRRYGYTGSGEKV